MHRERALGGEEAATREGQELAHYDADAAKRYTLPKPIVVAAVADVGKAAAPPKIGAEAGAEGVAPTPAAAPPRRKKNVRGRAGAGSSSGLLSPGVLGAVPSARARWRVRQAVPVAHTVELPVGIAVEGRPHDGAVRRGRCSSEGAGGRWREAATGSSA